MLNYWGIQQAQNCNILQVFSASVSKNPQPPWKRGFNGKAKIPQSKAGRKVKLLHLPDWKVFCGLREEVRMIGKGKQNRWNRRWKAEGTWAHSFVCSLETGHLMVKKTPW